MKRFICLFLALCLPLTALADTVAERVNAPDTWQGEFQSTSGKSHIYVNMTVQIPDADAFPIYAVAPRTFAVEEITHFADVMLGEGNWVPTDDWGDDLPGMEPGYLTRETSSGMSYYCTLSAQNADVGAVYDTVDLVPGWYMFNYMSYRLGGRYFGKDIGPVDDAQALTDAVVAQIAPDMVLDSVDPELAELPYRTGFQGQWEYGYRFYYVRSLNGISVTHVSQQGASEVLDLKNPIYAPVLPYEKLYVDVGEEGIFSLKWEHPIEVTGILAEDCELLPFDKIMDIFGAIAPLSIQSTESFANNALYINRAVLGYMCVPERGNISNYRLIPVWDFFGERTMQRDRETDPYWSYLTINAIDGTIIDRNYGY